MPFILTPPSNPFASRREGRTCAGAFEVVVEWFVGFGLEPGASQELSVEYTPSGSLPSKIRLRATVDSVNSVSESRENNNRRSEDFNTIRYYYPLEEGPFEVGYEVVDIPLSDDCEEDIVDCPSEIPAIIYYPARANGLARRVARGGPFPLIVFGHASRDSDPGAFGVDLCPGAPEDITQDYRQLSGILSHLASRGFVTIAPDLSWISGYYGVIGAAHPNRVGALRDAINYMIGENGRGQSRFHNKIRTTGIGAMGYSAGGSSTVILGTDGSVPNIEAMVLIAPVDVTWWGSPPASVVIDSFAPNPVLILDGTADTGLFGCCPYGRDAPADIYEGAGATKYLVTIDGANHYGYTDDICLEPPGDGDADISQANQRKIAKAYITAFFEWHLRGTMGMDEYLTHVRTVEGLEDFDDILDFQYDISAAAAESTEVELPSLPAIVPLELQAVRLRATHSGSMPTYEIQVRGQGITGVQVQVFDLQGFKVIGQEALGNRLRFQALDNRGRPLANGVYLYVVTVRGVNAEAVQSEVKKLIVLR